MTVPSAGSSTDPERRSALLNIKLKALVREHLGTKVELPDLDQRIPFGRGTAAVIGTTAWVLLDEQPRRGLGAALAWFNRVRTQSAVDSVSLIADESTGLLSRRAELFSTPIAVWHAVDRLLLAGLPEPYPESAPVDSTHEAFRTLIVDGGAEPLVEHGILVGEVRGLEVCRVVTDLYTDEVRLEVGVGAHDREAFSMLHGARPTVEALADVVDAVQRHREVGAALHPLNRFGAERFLRWLLLQQPEHVGAVSLRPADPPVIRTNIKDPVPCVAIGESVDGVPMVVVCSTGIDLDLIPFAVDARAMHRPEAELVVVVPPRDLSPITQAIAASTLAPTRVIGLSGP